VKTTKCHWVTKDIKRQICSVD